jgi:hypothetical protein
VEVDSQPSVGESKQILTEQALCRAVSGGERYSAGLGNLQQITLAVGIGEYVEQVVD